MTRSLLILGSIAALAVSAGTASAQAVYVQPAPLYVNPPVYASPPPVYVNPGITIGGVVRLPGNVYLGGSYGSPYNSYYSRPYYTYSNYGYGHSYYGHSHHYHR